MRRFYPPTESDIPMHGWTPYSDIHRERIRAHEKHDLNGDSMERKSWNEFDIWLSVVGEEWGEVNRTLCEHRIKGTYGEFWEMADELRGELVQVAAMIMSWVDAIDEERCGMRPRNGPFDDYCAKAPHLDGEHLSWSGRKYTKWVTSHEWHRVNKDDKKLQRS